MDLGGTRIPTNTAAYNTASPRQSWDTVSQGTKTNRTRPGRSPTDFYGPARKGRGETQNGSPSAREPRWPAPDNSPSPSGRPRSLIQGRPTRQPQASLKGTLSPLGAPARATFRSLLISSSDPPPSRGLLVAGGL